jgi:hypothetical protein
MKQGQFMIDYKISQEYIIEALAQWEENIICLMSENEELKHG